jgi:adenylosuccinate synthase
MSSLTSLQINKVDVVLGSQLGDEGKGRVIDILAAKYDIVARCNSGSNAGHKVVVGDKSYAFHLIPSGILNLNCIGIIGNGCVINLQDLRKEIETIRETYTKTNINNDAVLNITKRLLISDRAHIVLNAHKEADAIRELQKSQSSNPKSIIGTTKQGMGPVYSTKALRVGIRMCDLLLDRPILEEKVKGLVGELEKTLGYEININDLMKDIEEQIEFYRPMICDTITYLNMAINNDKRVLIEIAQACLLDVDFGVYPYCTATNCSVGAICSGLGIPAHTIGKINYVLKTYCTRVGNGPFPTELLDSGAGGGADDGILCDQLQTIGHEYGTTTNRKRRCGWLDIPMVKWATMINGLSNATLSLIKLDVLDTFKEIKIGVTYKISGKEVCGFPSSLEKLADVEVEYEVFDGWMMPTTDIRDFKSLPTNAKIYLKRIEELLGIPINYIGVGAERDAMIYIH